MNLLALNKSYQTLIGDFTTKNAASTGKKTHEIKLITGCSSSKLVHLILEAMNLITLEHWGTSSIDFCPRAIGSGFIFAPTQSSSRSHSLQLLRKSLTHDLPEFRGVFLRLFLPHSSHLSMALSSSFPTPWPHGMHGIHGIHPPEDSIKGGVHVQALVQIGRPGQRKADEPRGRRLG